MTVERRFAECRLEGDVVRGVLTTYGKSYSVGGQFEERFRAGAFGNVSQLDAIANFMHVRARPLARTGDGDLRLIDSPVELRAEVTLPDTRDGADTRTLIDKGVLRGFSLEFRATRQTFVQGVRDIAEATLFGLGIVDSPENPEAVILRFTPPPGEVRKRHWLGFQ